MLGKRKEAQEICPLSPKSLFGLMRLEGDEVSASRPWGAGHVPGIVAAVSIRIIDIQASIIAANFQKRYQKTRCPSVLLPSVSACVAEIARTQSTKSSSVPDLVAMLRLFSFLFSFSRLFLPVFVALSFSIENGEDTYGRTCVARLVSA